MTRRGKVIWALLTVVAGAATLETLLRATQGSLGVRCYHAVERAAIDDEAAAACVPLTRLALWPRGEQSARDILSEILREPLPSDVLVFAAARALSSGLKEADASDLYSAAAVAAMDSGPERRYLVVALLPLALRSGKCFRGSDVQEVVAAYRLVGWPVRIQFQDPRTNDEEEAARRVLDVCSALQPAASM